MAFSNQQYREIRNHLAGLLREAGLGTVHDEVEAQVREEETQAEVEQESVLTEGLRTQTINYFMYVERALNSRSQHTYRQALNISREVIGTEDGTPFSGYFLLATPADQQFLGFERIDLAKTPDMDELIQGLRIVISALEAE